MSLAILFQEMDVELAPSPWNVRYGSVLGTFTFSLQIPFSVSTTSHYKLYTILAMAEGDRFTF